MTRDDTLLNELRKLLAGYTPTERVDLLGMINEGYCQRCGKVEDGPLRSVADDLGQRSVAQGSGLLGVSWGL